MGAARARFAAEIETFENHRNAWLVAGLDGRWVAVRGSRFCGPFVSSDEAWRAGIEQLGGPGFLLRKVVTVDRPSVVSHICFEDPNGTS